MFKYLISVRVDSTLENGGKIELDSFIEATPEEQEKLKLAKDMYKNEMWKTTQNEALETFGVSHFLVLNGFMLRANVNMLSVHLLESEIQLSREDLQIWVWSCNVDPTAKQKLLDSRIGGK